MVVSRNFTMSFRLKARKDHENAPSDAADEALYYLYGKIFPIMVEKKNPSCLNCHTQSQTYFFLQKLRRLQAKIRE